MNLSLHVGAAIIGMLLLITIVRSVFHVAVINRQTGDWLSRGVGRLVYSTVARRAKMQQSYADIQDVLAWDLPLYIMLLIVVWFGLVEAGFSLLIWSSQGEFSPFQAIIASGSALSTLGFLTPPNSAGHLLAIVEGATGLGIVVFYFTFIPGYQTSIQLRQAKVAWLYARGGPSLTNFTLVEWFQCCGGTDWNGLWEDWESWFRNITETHALVPILAFVPTVHRDQTWLAAAAVALDSVSFFLSALEAQGIPSAIVCHRTGVDALHLIAAKLSHCRWGASEEPGGQRLTRYDFDAACERLTALGAKVKAERDACWRRFAELRREYEASLLSLAASLLVPAHNSLLLPLPVCAEPSSAAQSATGTSPAPAMLTRRG
jgi:hypothetical protein